MLAVTLFAAAPAATFEQAVDVLDGRSFVTASGLRIRLLGLAGPGIGEPGGDICRDVLEKYVAGREVRLEPDRSAADSGGWLSRYVFAGETLVNAIVVRKGYAKVALSDSGWRYRDTLRALERTAARVEKGLWPFAVFPPPEFSGRDPGLTDTSSADSWLETVAYDQADRYYGRIVRVIGTVVATYRSDKVFIMNFHQDFRRYFKAAIFAGDLDRFPPSPEDYYKKRVVRVTGLVKEYAGAPEMILTDPGQVEVIE